MKKIELEELLKHQAEQITALNHAHEREIKVLVDTIEKLKEEREGPRLTLRRRVPSPEEREKRDTSYLESRKERVLNLFKTMGKTRDVPRIEDYVKENYFANLEDIDDATFTVLIRQHLNREIADAYASRKMNRRVYTAVVHYFDDYADFKPLEIADEFKAELEQLRADAAAREEERKRLKPTDGPFKLRGRAELEQFLNEHVVDIVNRHADYSRFGVHFPKGFVLEGKPGCGKTFAVERLAEHLKWHVVRIDSGSIGSTFIHATAKKIQEKFQEAAEKAPSIVIIDEMEAFTRNRANLPGHNTHSAEEVDSFLQCLQTAAERHILVAGMTNHIETIDPAILRTGRLGAHIKVDMPSLQEVQDVLAYALEKLPHAEFDLHPLAERLLDHPLSDVTHAVDEAGMNAARAGHERIEEEDLAHAIDDMLRRQSAEKPEGRRFGFAE